MDKRINELRKAKNWAAVADELEALPQKQRLERSYFWLESLERSGRWARLLEVCEVTVLLGKPGSNPFLTHFKGKALSELGRHAEALAWFCEGGKKGDITAYLEASNEAQALSDWKTLLEIAEVLVDRYPTSGAYLGLKGQALAKLGRYDDAELALNESVHLVPKGAMNWADLACCYNEHGKYQEAYDAAAQAVALDPRLMEGLCNRGRACFGLKRYKEGRDDYATALALNPQDAAIVRNLKLNISMADKFLAHRETKASKRPSGKL
ncbi:MAG: tetratricopeptide repeat protein [Holophaga sp.]|nr:tetratricopeptide repeat protein [Holophaga sp.]